ncbi:MAG: hypothetical protein IM574_01140, partial [Cytophagales bacterium]|nr:hypothetical protein [Cytophagales bacterium]
MKVIKGIDKGNNSTKELEYTNDWGKVIKDDKVIQKLKKLQSLISNTSEEGNFEQMQKEAFRLRKSLFDHNKPPSTILNGVRDDIYKITLLGKRGKTKRDKAIVINHPTMIDFIIASFYSKLHTFAQAPTNGKPISNLKKLLSNGGYEIILELQKTL